MSKETYEIPQTPSWCQFKGDGKEKDLKLPKLPPWRDKTKDKESYIPLSAKEIKMVNAALLLRRPLLITGDPGTGKSSLAKAVVKELKMGSLLSWHITTQSVLQDALYSYDAIARLQDVQLQEKNPDIKTDMHKYLKLGALGKAFVSKTTRVVLIDEIDKSDIDLPNNLLHVFEEQSFDIPELKRLDNEKFYPYGKEQKDIVIEKGKVSCTNFPLIIMTSNGERDFPPAFMRRCLHLHLKQPDKNQLAYIVTSHFEDIDVDKKVFIDIIDKFINIRDKKMLSTDQLLNAVYLLNDKNVIDISDDANSDILDSIWKPLTS